MQQLSVTDATFLYLDSARAPMHVGGLLIYDPGDEPFNMDDMLEFYEERLHLAKAFRRRIVRVPLNLDHPYWIEDGDFDLEFHVRHTALPQPGNWDQLCTLVGRLMSRPVDLSRPPWEVYIIEGLNDIPGLHAGCYATFTKVHHVAIDGVSGAELTAALHSLEPNAPPPNGELDYDWEGEREPNPVELLTRAHLNNLRNPFRLGRTLANTVPALAKVSMGMMTRDIKPPSPPGHVPWTRFNGNVSPHRVFEGRVFDLDKMKAIKNGVDGAKLNDVVLAVVGGALHHYLNEHHELPEDSMIALAPISTRTPEQMREEGNQISFMTAKLGTDIDDPMERLTAVLESTQSSKALTHAVGANLLTDYLQFIPSSVAGMASRVISQILLANPISPSWNCVVTNVPGPQVPLYCGHAQLVQHYGLGPLFDGTGLNIAIFSYHGTLSIAINACRQMMPDPHFFADCLEHSFDELYKTVPKPKKAAGKKPASKKRSKSKAAKSGTAKKRATSKRKPTAKAKAKAQSKQEALSDNHGHEPELEAPASEPEQSKPQEGGAGGSEA